jgi:hypothetical protein
MVVILSFINMRAIWKVTSSGLLTKQAMREKHSIMYRKYVHTSAISQHSHCWN